MSLKFETKKEKENQEANTKRQSVCDKEKEKEKGRGSHRWLGGGIARHIEEFTSSIDGIPPWLILADKHGLFPAPVFEALTRVEFCLSIGREPPSRPKLLISGILRRGSSL
jgi:hypothetical protein